MACYHPVEVGVLGKPLWPGAPRILNPMTVGCGNCLGCRADQARDWTFRNLHESQMHDYSWFVTLTYDEENCPENHQLNPSHLRKFFKTMRRDTTLRYYAVGEYGDTTQRPHYHALLYGPSFLDRVSYTNRAGAKVWRSQTLDDAWGLGLTEIGTLTPASAAYCAGYVQKKLGRKKDSEDHNRVNPHTGELIDWQPEFSRMSLKPAIGRTWIEKYWKDVYPRDYIVVRGQQYRPPRYYDKWMDQHHPEVMAETRWKRVQELPELLTEFELRSKEKHHKAKDRLFNHSGGKI